MDATSRRSCEASFNGAEGAVESDKRIRDVTGEDPAFGSSADHPPEIEAAFLESVLAFETAPKRILFELLTETGMDFRVQPDSLTAN